MAASLTEVLSAMQLTNQILSKIQQTLAGAGTAGSVPRGYLAGAATSNNAGTPNTKVDIAAGVSTDSGNTVLINSTGVVTIDFSTVGANGLDAAAIAALTTYHIFLISQAGNINAAGIASTSLTPALPTNYSYYRRVGSVVTSGAATIRPYYQTGDQFFYITPTLDISAAAPGAGAVTRALTAPTGVVNEAIMRVGTTNGAVAQDGVLLSPLAVTDVVPINALQCTVGTGAGAGVNSVGMARCLTNTSAQIRSRMVSGGAGSALTIYLEGWRDFLGRLA